MEKETKKYFYDCAEAMTRTTPVFMAASETLSILIFLGGIAVIVLFALFIWQITRIIKQAVDPFGYYLCFGILVMMSIQVAVNFGVSIGALPTKGLPLPFIEKNFKAGILISMGIVFGR